MENRRIKILAIDDNQDNLISLKALVKDAFPDATTLTALTGPKGIELAGAEDPDVILLDIVMPDMDGFEVCKKLKADKLLSDIPVVFVTAIKGDKESRIRALECGAEAFLAKPIDETELTAQIRAMVKIKTAVIEKRDEKERLEKLVEVRTKLLQQQLKERKLTEDALRESEKRFRSYIEHAPDGIFISDEKGNYVAVNSAACRITGYSEEELLKLSIPEILFPEDVPIGLQHFREVNEKGFARDDNRFVTKEGEVRFWSVVAVKLSGTRFLGFVQDITQRKLAEEEVKQSQVLSKTIIDSIPGTFYVIDANGKYSGWNSYQRDEIVGLPDNRMTDVYAIDTIHPDDRLNIGEKIGNVLKNGAEEVVEGRVLLRGGPDFRWFLLTGRRLMIDGSPILVGTGIDITGRRQAELDLRKSEENLAITLNSIGDGVISTDRSGLIVNMNPVAEKLCGWKLTDALGKPLPEVFRLVDSETHEDVANPVEMVFENGEIVGLANHTVLISKDGTEYQIADSAAPIKNRDGLIIGVVLVFSDVTEKYASQRLINDSEARYRSLLENLEAGIVVHAPDTSIVMSNHRASELLGLSDDQMRGKVAIDPAWRFINEDHAPLSLDEYPVNRIFNGRQPIKDQVLGIQQPGNSEVVWVTVNGFPVLDKWGEITEMVISFIDITERKQAEAALRESELRFKALHDASFGGITIHDRGLILECNQGLSEITGYSYQELIGMDGLLLIAPESRELVRNNIAAGFEQPYEALGIRKNGEIFPLRLEARNIPYKGKQVRTVEFRDITEYKQAERLILRKSGEIEAQNEELQQINEELNQANEELAVAIKRTEESENRFTLAMKASTDGLFDWNLETNDIYYSPGWKSILGYEDHELPNDFSVWETTTDPVDVKRSWELQQKLLTKQIDRFVMEFKMKHKKGHWVDVLARSEAFFNDQGKAVRMVGTHTDITERKQAVEALRESEEKFRDMANLLPQIIFESDSDGRLTYLNNNAFITFGYPNDYPILGKSSLDFYTPESRHKAIENIRQKISGNQVSLSNEYVMVKNDGSTFPALVYSNPILKEGKPVGLRGIIVNITELKQAEHALRESEARFKSMFERHSSIMLLIEPETGRITGANEASVKFYGYTKAQLTAMRIDEINMLAPEQVKKERELAVLLEANYFEFPHRLASGEVRTVEVHSTPIVFQDQQILFSIIHDITERKKAEEALRGSEEMMISSQAVAHICSYSTTLNASELGKSVWVCSPEFYKIFGIDKTYPHTIAGWAGFIHPDHREEVIAYHESVLRDRKSFDREYKIIRISDGIERWVQGTGELVYDEQGNPIRMHGAIQDITERKLAEDALRKSESVKNIMVSNIGDVIVIIDKDGINRYKSPNIERWFGWKPEDLVGKSTYDNVHPEDLETCQKFIQSLAEGTDKSGTIELRYLRKDGSYCPIEITMSNLLQDPNIQGFLGNYHNISERKKNEEKSQLLSSILDYSQDFIGLATPDQKAFYVNPAGQKMVGIESDQMARSTRVEDYFFPEDQPFVNNTIFPALMRDGRWAGEFRFKNHKTNEPVHVFYDLFLTADPVTKKIINIATISRDITAQKIVEQELIAAKERAEESDRLKSAFLANMSHEIRTPMNGILGFADLLKEPGLKGEQQQKYIGIIEKSGKRMLNIINDIVDISKIEAGLMKLHLTESNINEQIEYIYTFFKPEVEAKGISFSFKNVLPAQAATITTDREKVFAILTNLVKNAIKYTPGGAIEFGYDLVEEPGPAPLQLTFYVKDTGIGIPYERQAAIFERFVQADIEDRDARQGAGLGLTITKSYVEMLGGKIWVVSRQGEGTVFYFTLPYKSGLAGETIVEQTEFADKTDEGKKLKILIAEDDDSSEMLIEINVNKLGREIIRARTGTEAVESCRRNADIDLVLMDIQMPEMSGYEATRRIREFNRDVIIIAQTAYGLTGDKEKAIAAGCNDYISKPVKKEALIALIQKNFKK